jgi:hypothetical protein
MVFHWCTLRAQSIDAGPVYRAVSNNERLASCLSSNGEMSDTERNHRYAETTSGASIEGLSSIRVWRRKAHATCCNCFESIPRPHSGI